MRTLAPLLALVLAACAGGARSTARPAGPDWVESIADLATWEALASRPELSTTARTEAVKIVLDLHDGDHLYLLDSRRWDLHFTFVRAFLEPHADHATFNRQQYRRPDRRYLLGTLVRYLDGDRWALELVADDTLDAEGIAFFFEHVRPRVWFGDRLRYHPLSPRQEAAAASLPARLPVLTASEVQAEVRYQPLVPGEAFGVLRLRRGAIDPATLAPDEIVVSDDVPDELAPIQALVTSRLQAPLAHVAVLSRNRRTPDMALRGAIDDPRFVALEGRLVHLVVGPQEFSIEPARAEDAERSWAAQRPSRPFVPRMRAEAAELIETCNLRMDDVDSAGAKASQLGELCSLGDGITTPGGFVVPLHHDLAHRSRHRLHARIAAMLGDEALRADPIARAARLGELRAAIEAGDVDPALLAEVTRRIAAEPRRRFILRSSTNAEDLVGFNGAGLYESVVLPASPSEGAIADALRRVWASVWLTRAFEEREWYRIDHAGVAMAILVQPFVDDVLANGVAITANPFFEGRPGVFVNVQTREGSVTGARGDELPEQWLVYTWSEAYEPELLARSSLGGGAPILLPADLEALTRQLVRIHERFVPHYGPRANAVDVELLMTRDHRFVFVQARAYQVSYGPGQRWGESRR